MGWARVGVGGTRSRGARAQGARQSRGGRGGAAVTQRAADPPHRQGSPEGAWGRLQPRAEGSEAGTSIPGSVPTGKARTWPASEAPTGGGRLPGCPRL